MITQYRGYKAIRSFSIIKLQIESGECKDDEKLIALQDEQDKQLFCKHVKNYASCCRYILNVCIV